MRVRVRSLLWFVALLAVGGLCWLVVRTATSRAPSGDTRAAVVETGLPAGGPEQVPPDESRPVRRRERVPVTAAADEPAPAATADAPAPPPRPLLLGHLVVAEGETRVLPAGEVRVSGDVRIDGRLDASKSTVVLDGDDQALEGTLSASRLVFERGIKRLRGGFESNRRADAEVGDAGVVVAAGATLLVEKGGTLHVHAAYGFTVAGAVVIDGGLFRCSFSNGNGRDRGSLAWLPGSRLEVRSGRFHGGGDADFGEAEIVVHDGEIAIDDDVWRTGRSLVMHGGVFRNSTYGGWLSLTGRVDLHGGTLQAAGNVRRGLRVAPGATVHATGGQVVLASATRFGGGKRLRIREVASGGSEARSAVPLVLGESATLHDLHVRAPARIDEGRSATGVLLRVAGELTVEKGVRFDVSARGLDAAWNDTDENGEVVR